MKKIVLIPLDDRPVCVDRILLQAQACGFKVILPDKDLYATKLDGQPLNSNGTPAGNSGGLEKWLEAQIQEDVTAYILSLDQMLSGGLVNSRSISNLSIEPEKRIIEKFFGEEGLLRDKKVYVFDTVMRLAPTVFYKNYDHGDYVNIRNFGKIARLQFWGNHLNFHNIVQSYHLDASGNEIAIPEGITDLKRSKYYHSRERKLSLTDYFIKASQKMENLYLICGIDDSSPEVTIQTNEIRYIEKIIANCGNVIIGTDELTSMLLTRFCTDYYQFIPRVELTFIGDQIDVAADAYDNGTLRQNIFNHLNDMKIMHSEDQYEVEIVIMTKPSETFPYEKNVSETIKKVKENLTLEIPTILIDCSTWDLYGILEKELAKESFIGSLLGYSNWNTVANAVGLALGQGISRFIYLNQKQTLREERIATKAFVELLALSFYKDMGYKIGCNHEMNTYIQDHAVDKNGMKPKDSFMNFYQYLTYTGEDFTEVLDQKMRSADNPCNIELLKKNLCKNKVLARYHRKKASRKYYMIVDIKKEKFSFSWFRHFEITIELEAEIKKI